jgi:hypothetical protein
VLLDDAWLTCEDCSRVYDYEAEQKRIRNHHRARTCVPAAAGGRDYLFLLPTAGGRFHPRARRSALVRGSTPPPGGAAYPQPRPGPLPLHALASPPTARPVVGCV